MWRRGKVVWSPIEVEYLRTHRDMAVNQLTVALAKSRAAIKRKCDELDGKPAPIKKNKISRIGKRSDIIGPDGKPLFFRSGWEANVARWLTHTGRTWEYEPNVFSFFEFGIKRGTVSYCPDFKTPSTWIEVKGMLTNQGKTAIRRFKKFYPQEFKKLRAIVGSKNTKADKFFKEIGVPVIAYVSDLNKKYKSTVEHWE